MGVIKGRSNEEAAALRQEIYQAWVAYQQQCEGVGATPNARKFVQMWNERYPDKEVSYSHFSYHIKRGT